MSVGSSLISARRAMLRDPLCDIAFAPNPPGREFADWLREARRFRQLVSALTRHTEQLADLGYSDEFHRVRV